MVAEIQITKMMKLKWTLSALEIGLPWGIVTPKSARRVRSTAIFRPEECEPMANEQVLYVECSSFELSNVVKIYPGVGKQICKCNILL